MPQVQPKKEKKKRGEKKENKEIKKKKKKTFKTGSTVQDQGQNSLVPEIKIQVPFNLNI